MIDMHVHLWEHAPGPLRVERAQLERYCEVAASRGVEAIAITEHLDRFHQVRAVLDGAWADDPNRDLRDFMDSVFAEEQGADLDDYVTELTRARDQGLPILVGVELGWWPDRGTALADVVRAYPFDVALGSVHSLGAWMFDAYGDPAVVAEWSRRNIEDTWDRYAKAIEEMAAARVCDVLAHVDLIKITGRRPSAEAPFHDRLAHAAAANDLAVEVSSAGWRKPVGEVYPSPELLRRLAEEGVPVTLASDAHRAADVGDRLGDLRRLALEAGHRGVARFDDRRREVVALD